MDFDGFMNLEWLFPSRRQRVDLEEVRRMIAGRGVCVYSGQVRPWSQTVCKCTGYVFKNQYRGAAYCECGDQRVAHRFKARETEE